MQHALDYRHADASRESSGPVIIGDVAEYIEDKAATNAIHVKQGPLRLRARWIERKGLTSNVP